MKRLLLSLVILSISAFAADATGKWSGSAQVNVNGEDQDYSVYLVLKQDGAKLTGTAGQSADQQGDIENGVASGDTIEFDFKPGEDAPPMHFKFKVDGDSLRGEGNGEGDGNTVKAKLELKREK